MKKINIYFYIWGGGGPGGTLTSNPGLPNFRGSKTSSQSRQIHNKEKYNRQFFIYGPQCEEICIFCHFIHIWGGPGGPLRQTQGYQIFRAVRSHYRADKFIKINKK